MIVSNNDPNAPLVIHGKKHREAINSEYDHRVAGRFLIGGGSVFSASISDTILFLVLLFFMRRKKNMPAK